MPGQCFSVVCPRSHGPCMVFASSCSVCCLANVGHSPSCLLCAGLCVQPNFVTLMACGTVCTIWLRHGKTWQPTLLRRAPAAVGPCTVHRQPNPRPTTSHTPFPGPFPAAAELPAGSNLCSGGRATFSIDSISRLTAASLLGCQCLEPEGGVHQVQT